MRKEYMIDTDTVHETWKGWALLVPIVLATAGVFYWTAPWFMRQETANTRGSLSYISTHQGILRQLKTSYDAIEARLADTLNVPANAELRAGLRNQQRSVLLQMRQEADLIPHEVPADIQDVLHSTP